MEVGRVDVRAVDRDEKAVDWGSGFGSVAGVSGCLVSLSFVSNEKVGLKEKPCAKGDFAASICLVSFPSDCCGAGVVAVVCTDVLSGVVVEEGTLKEKVSCRGGRSVGNVNGA